MAKQASKRRRHVEFQTGDAVLLSVRNVSLKIEASKKLMNPYKVMKRFRSVTYERDLPLSPKMYSVFHVSVVPKHCRRGGPHITVPPPALLPTGGMEYEVESNLEHSARQLNGLGELCKMLDWLQQLLTALHCVASDVLLDMIRPLSGLLHCQRSRSSLAPRPPSTATNDDLLA